MAEKSSSNFWDTATYVPYEPEKKKDSFWDTATYVPYEPSNNESSDPGSIRALTARENVSGAYQGNLGNGLISGVVGGAADAFALPANLAINAHNASLEQNSRIDPQSLAISNAMAMTGMGGFSPQVSPEQVEASKISNIPSLTEKTEKFLGVDPSKEGPVYEGFKMAGSVLGPGLGAKALKGATYLGEKGFGIAKGFAKPLSLMGSTKPAVLAGAGAGGAASELAKEEGFGAGGQLGAGFGANTAIQLANPRNIGKGVVTAFGLGKGQLKTDVAEAGKRIDTDLLTVGVSDSKLLAFINQQISKLPWLGDYLKGKYEKSSKQFQDAFGKLADSVGPKLTDEVKEVNRSLYQQADELLPQNAFMSPKNTIDQIDNLLKSNTTLIKSKKTSELFDVLEEAQKGLGGGKIVPIDILVNTKKNINSMVKWDSDKKGPLALIQRALKEDIAAYGKTNQPWYQQFQQAEESFARSAKRERLEELVAGKISDPISGEVKNISFVKQLSDPKQKEKIENILGKSNVHKLEDFITVAKGMAQAERNILNPSGTAPTETVKSFIKLLGGVLLGTVSLPAAAAVGAVTAATTYLIGDKRFLNLALKYAKTPSQPVAKQLEAVIKENTGYTIQTLSKMYQEGGKSKTE